MSKPYVLVPLTITDAMLSSATIAEPDTGETAWASGGTYAVDAEVIRTTTHRVYSCVQAHTGRTALPEVDSAYWLEKRPTMRWAAFDAYRNTKATTTGTFTYVLRPGFFNSLGFFGLVGGTLEVTIKDTPGGTTYYTSTTDLTEPYSGFYELLVRPPAQRTSLMLRDLPLLPNPELTVTIISGTGISRGVGMVAIGDLAPLVDDSVWSGVEDGAQANPKSYSYFKANADGTTEIKRGLSATDLSGSIIMPTSVADSVLTTIQSVLDVPAACVLSDSSGFTGLAGFGLISGSMSYGPVMSKFNYSVKGYI